MSEDDDARTSQQDHRGAEGVSANTAEAPARPTPAMRLSESGYNGTTEPYITHIDGRLVGYSRQFFGRSGNEEQLVMQARLEDGRHETWTLPEPCMNDESQASVSRALAAMLAHVRSLMHIETPEDRARFDEQEAERERAREQRTNEARKKFEERAARQKAAQERAKVTLWKYLDPKQRRQYKRDCCFEVVGGSSGHIYRIDPAAEGNVMLLDKPGGKEVSRFCCGPKRFMEGDDIPLSVADIQLSQLWLLSSTNEVAYFKKANLYGGTRWPINVPGLREVLIGRGYAIDDESWKTGRVSSRPCFCGVPDCRQ